MQNAKRIWVWVGIVVVVLIIGIFVVLAFVSKSTPTPGTVSVPAPVYAPQGQLAPGFPKYLILDPQAQIGSSYSINYDPTTNQYTARWISSSSVATIYGQYKSYFGNNGWVLSNSSGATSASKIAAMYAATSSAKVNVTMLSKSGGAEVTVSYVGYK
jgi:hypothetical protein